MTKAKASKMNPRTKRKLDKINNRLEIYEQKTRIIDMSCSSILLNTGAVFKDNEAGKFIKRVMNTKVVDWVKNTDKLLSGEIEPNAIKLISLVLGGKRCQELHGDRIKNNLNTGISWNSGTKGQNLNTLGPLPQSVKDKISIKNSGSGNGMYGVKMSDIDKKIKSDKMKKKILLGEFTPNSNNRNTHWESTFDGKLYRSSWEALYQYFNQHAEYEKLRISYSVNNNEKIYIVDFIDHVNKLVVEVKPKELCVGSIFKAKISALNIWATNHQYSVLMITKQWLQEQKEKIDYSRFDEKTATKIKGLYETSKKN